MHLIFSESGLSVKTQSWVWDPGIYSLRNHIVSRWNFDSIILLILSSIILSNILYGLHNIIGALYSVPVGVNIAVAQSTGIFILFHVFSNILCNKFISCFLTREVGLSPTIPGSFLLFISQMFLGLHPWSFPLAMLYFIHDWEEGYMFIWTYNDKLERSSPRVTQFFKYLSARRVSTIFGIQYVVYFNVFFLFIYCGLHPLMFLTIITLHFEIKFSLLVNVCCSLFCLINII